MVHLELPLEVGDHAEPLHHRRGLVLACELDDELGEHVDDDVLEASERVLEERDALLDGEERLLVRGIADDADDDPVEDRRGAPDHVDVAVRDGVVAPWADCSDHRREDRNPRGTVAPARDEVERKLRLDALGRLDHDEAVVGEHVRKQLRELGRVPLPLLVGRVDEDEVVAASTRTLLAESRGDVAVRDRRAGEPQLLEVRPDHPRGVAIALDEDAARSAARQRLEAQRARAGEEVEHRRSLDRPDQRERRLAHAVAGRPRAGLRRGDPVALPRARDDPHDSPRCSASPRRRSTSSASRPSSASARAASRARSSRSWSRRSRTKRRSE